MRGRCSGIVAELPGSSDEFVAIILLSSSEKPSEHADEAVGQLVEADLLNRAASHNGASICAPYVRLCACQCADECVYTPAYTCSERKYMRGVLHRARPTLARF